MDRQILVHHAGRTRVLHFTLRDGNACVTTGAVLQRLEQLDGAPAASLALQHGTRRLRRGSSAPFAPEMLRATPVRAVVGGKGGFGAMLRALGKSGGQKTKDFGACRDLNGRRLRHVNDEIKLQKWADLQAAKRAAKDRGEKWHEPLPERTASGIDGWHLGVPSWIEGAVGDKMSRSERRQRAQRRTPAQEEAEARAAGVPLERFVGRVTLVDSYRHGFCIVNGDVYVPFSANEDAEQDDWVTSLKVGDKLHVVAAMKRQRRNKWRAVRARRARAGDSVVACMDVGMHGQMHGGHTRHIGMRGDQAASTSHAGRWEHSGAGGATSGSNDGSAPSTSSMASLVQAGMAAARQTKRRRLARESISVASVLPAGKGAVTMASAAAHTSVGATSSAPGSGSGASASVSGGPSPSPSACPSHAAAWLGTLSGIVSLGRDGLIIGGDDQDAEFSSVCVLGCELDVRAEAGARSGAQTQKCARTQHRGLTMPCQHWYYEVELLSSGVMQVGWASHQFRGSSDNGDGVGDDAASWAYDGLRQLKWSGDGSLAHCEGRAEYGAGRDSWQAGDVVGCLLELESDGTAQMVFSLNGEDLGPAFTVNFAADAAQIEGAPETVRVRGLFPAMSVEDREALRINIGQRPFRFNANELLKTSSMPSSSSSSSASTAIASEQHVRGVIDAVDGRLRAVIVAEAQAADAAADAAAEAAAEAASEAAAQAAAADAAEAAADAASEVAAEAVVLSQPQVPSTPTPPTAASENNDGEDASRGTSAGGVAGAAPTAASDVRSASMETVASKMEAVAKPLDLSAYSSQAELEALGLERLKCALLHLGLKCGGTLQQRAERLMLVKGLDPSDFPPKLLAKRAKRKTAQ